MVHESPGEPKGRIGRLPLTPDTVQPGSADPARVRDNIQRLIDNRLADDAATSAMEKRATELRAALKKILDDEKRLRIDKVRASAERDRLKAGILELRKERLKKDSVVASYRSRLVSLRVENTGTATSEDERLEAQVRELRSDVEAFRETLNMHRRDRDRVFNRLLKAQSRLQDKLTESMLWKILNLDSSEDEEPGARKGISGVAAELLGRLLVLEKEECQVFSLLNRLDCISNGESASQ